MLPEPLKPYVVEGALAIGCDEAFVVSPLLAAVASAVGATRRIELKPGWAEPSVVWTAVVADSGTLKTPSMDLALRPLKRLQGLRLEEHRDLQRQFEIDTQLYEADYAAWKKQGRSRREPPPEKPTEPSVERYLVDDVTTEALADRLQNAPRGLLCCPDELNGWLRGFDAYRSGRGADVARWLSIHNAGQLLIDRKKAATIYVKRAPVSICGGIQPGTLQRSLGSDNIDNGLAPRLLLMCPPRRSKRWTDRAVPKELRRRVDVMFGRLLALDFGIDADGAPAPIDLPLTPEAKAAWVGFYDTHAKEVAQAVGERAAVLSKLEGAAARLSLIVHAVESVADNPTVTPGMVDEASITAGVEMAQWFACESERVYALLHETDADREARRLVDFIERRGGQVTPREVTRGLRHYRGNTDGAEAALTDLARAGLGTWHTRSTGGRPSYVFRLSSGVDGNGTT